MKRETLVAKLKQDLAECRVTTIVGTGVSVAATGNQEIEGCRVATWPGLLHHGVQHCAEIGAIDDFDVKMLTMQIDSGRPDYLIGAAETISNKMKKRAPGVYRGWLKNTIGSLVVADRRLIDTINLLPGMLATLNYDNLIEDITNRHAITWLETDAVEDSINGDASKSVLHLHGWYKEPNSVVLGLGSYLSVKDHAHAKSVLQHFTIGRTLLFIGCGTTFDDPNFDQLIHWGQEAIADVTPRHYLLCRNSELPKFLKALESAPWLQPLPYGNDYSELEPFLRSISPKQSGDLILRRTLSTIDLEAYRKAMLSRYKRLKIEQINTTTHDIRPLTLNGMYIEQNAKACNTFVPRVFELPKELQHKLRRKGEIDSAEIDDAALEQYKRAYVEQTPRLISEVLDDHTHSKIVVLGDPGSGKSTLLQHIILKWAELSTNELSGAPLPLLVELREFASFAKQFHTDSFLSYLHERAGVRWHLNKEGLAERLREYPSVLLFDGLDEIFDLDQRRVASTAIHRFAHEFPLARVVVTSRVVGYQHQAWNDEGFRHYMLQDLDSTQIRTFLDRWHNLAYEDHSTGENKRRLLERAITDSAAIRQLAGNPLLLTMMAVLNRTQDLPRDRAELYDQCARLLLHQWKIDVAFQTDPDLAKASLDFKDKRGLLLRVARAMHSGERGLAGNLIEEETLEETLASGLNEIRFALPARAARSLIEQLRGRNFMLCFMGGHSYAFVHRTFLEYFCAAEIQERFEKERSLSIEQLQQDVYSNWGDETWHEVLSLLASIISSKFADNILHWLIRQPDPSGGNHHIFLALRCLGEVRNRVLASEIERKLKNIAKNLSQFEPAYPYSGWTPEASKAEELRVKTLKMIATIWPDSEDTAEWLKHIAITSKLWESRSTALRLVVQGWSQQPETLNWLKTVAKSEGTLSGEALSELVKNWPADPELIDIVSSVLKRDDDDSGVAAAVTAMATLRASDPKTKQWLLSKATNTDTFYVAYTALYELAIRWRENADVFDCLKSFTKSFGPTYMAALHVLAEHWKDEPEVLDIFLGLVSEKNRNMREMAQNLMFHVWRTNPKVIAKAWEIVNFDMEAYIRSDVLSLIVSECRNDPATLPLVLSFAKNHEDFRARIDAIEHLAHWSDNHDVHHLVTELALSESDERVRGAALRTLAYNWTRLPSTVALIRDTAINDHSLHLRRTAIQVLQIIGMEKGTTELLYKIAHMDVSVEIRALAVQHLISLPNESRRAMEIIDAGLVPAMPTAHRAAMLKVLIDNCSSQPNSLQLLKKIASRDKSANLRLPALAEISRRRGEDVDILEILKKSVQKDRSKAVRMRALRELARGWNDDSDVLQLVAVRERLDSSGEVRGTAKSELERLRNYLN